MSENSERQTAGVQPDVFHRALTFAAARHAGTPRKGTRIPYVTHLVIVAETLIYYYPGETGLGIAGLLHDVIEDTGTTVDVVRDRFGVVVAELVAAVTKPDRSSVEIESADAATQKVELWRKQREAMLESLVHVTDTHMLKNVVRLKAADALANLRAIQRDLANPTVGERIWDRFKVGRAESLWFYEQIFEHMAPIQEEPLVRELEAALEGVGGTARLPATPGNRR